MKKCSSAIQSYYNENILHIEDDKIISSITEEGISKLTKVEKRYKEWFLQEHNCSCVANLYESKIHPQLRFIHEKDIQSCGWVKVTLPNATCLKSDDEKEFNVDYELCNIYSNCLKR